MYDFLSVTGPLVNRNKASLTSVVVKIHNSGNLSHSQHCVPNGIYYQQCAYAKIPGLTLLLLRPKCLFYYNNASRN